MSRRALTAREYEVLLLIAAGRGDRQIARRLEIGASTARTHVRNVMVKLGAENRANAVDLAWRTGLLS